MMIQVSGFGEDGSTIAETVGARPRFIEKSWNGQIKEKFSLFTRRTKIYLLANKRNFMTALAIGR